MSLLVGLGLLLWAQPALAEPALQSLDRALRHIAHAEFDSAIELLNRAKLASREPRLLGKIHLYLGVSHAILNQDDAARLAFREALLRDPELSLDPRQFKRSIIALFSSVRETVRGDLLVFADSTRPRVVVDGVQVGVAPLRVRLPVGRHRVEVHGPAGTSPCVEFVTVAAERPAEVRARLMLVPGSTARRREPGRAAIGEPKRRPESPPFYRRWWFWTAVGAVVVGGAIGGILAARGSVDQRIPEGELGTIQW